jgi:hypothetical protein
VITGGVLKCHGQSANDGTKQAKQVYSKNVGKEVVGDFRGGYMDAVKVLDKVRQLHYWLGARKV